MTNRSVVTVSPPRVKVTRSETLPAVHTTSPQRGSSACSSATLSRVAATASRTSASSSDRTILLDGLDGLDGLDDLDDLDDSDTMLSYLSLIPHRFPPVVGLAPERADPADAAHPAVFAAAWHRPW